MDQRRAVLAVVVVGAMVLLLLVGLPTLRPPDSDDTGVGFLEPLGDVGFGRDVRPEEVSAERCDLQPDPVLSADERRIEVPGRGTCTLSVAPASEGLLSPADRNRTLVLRPSAGPIGVTVHLEGLRASQGLTVEREISAGDDGVRVDLTCNRPQPCHAILGSGPGR